MGATRVVTEKRTKIEDFGEVLFTFPVLYTGWELDEKGYVVKAPDDSTLLVMSSHGRFYVAEANELREKLAEYETAILASRKALALLEPAK